VRYFCNFQNTAISKQSPNKQKFAQSETDVMILKIFSQKKIAKKIGVFDSKQS
jgi:hypothetical protein